MRIIIEYDEKTGSPTMVTEAPTIQSNAVEALDGGSAPQAAIDEVMPAPVANVENTVSSEGINAGASPDDVAWSNVDEDPSMADFDDAGTLYADPAEEESYDQSSATVSQTPPSYWETA